MLKKAASVSIALAMAAGAGVVTGVTNLNVKAASEKPITFTFFNGFLNATQYPSDSAIAKIITKATGVTIKTQYAVGDVDTKIGVLIASGQYPDFIYGNNSHQKFVSAGACIPLDNYIKKYGTNLRKIYANEMKRIVQADGHIYFFPPYRESIDLTTPGRGFYVQRRVLKEAGYPRIKTLDQYFNLVTNYQKKHPSTNGKSTIAFTSYTGDFWTITNAPNDLSGYPNDGTCQINPKTYEAKDYSVNSSSKNYFKKLNDLYNKGYMDKEMFTMNKDQFNAKVNEGRLLGFYGQQWQFLDAQNALQVAKKYEYKYVCLPVVWDTKTPDYYVYPAAPIVRDGISISKSCKDPVRAFKFMDYLMGEQTQKLINWGIKGKDYLTNAKGKAYRTVPIRTKTQDKPYQSKEGLGQFGYPWPINSGNAIYNDGTGTSWNPVNDPEEESASYDKNDREVLNAYHIKNYDDLFTIQKLRPWGEAWDIDYKAGSENAIKIQKLSDLQKQYVTKLIVSKPSQFESIWKDFLKQHEAIHMESVEKYTTQQIKWRIKHWTDLPVPNYSEK